MTEIIPELMSALRVLATSGEPFSTGHEMLRRWVPTVVGEHAALLRVTGKLERFHVKGRVCYRGCRAVPDPGA